MKKILASILLSCMVLSLCACGTGNGDTNKNSQNTQNTQNASESEKESESEEGVVYKITVVDEAGNPVSGVMVQLCKDSCFPKLTNANGVAEFPVTEVADGYKAGITNLPEGFVYEGEAEVYYEDGETEVTLVVKVVQ